MTTTQLSKVDPKDFGLEIEKAQTIESAFMPKIVEREALREIYSQIITSEITPVLCQRAKETRNKLVKVRTGIADIHRTQKAFFLAAGRFCDAWKNKETEPVLQMEETLSEIETHYERIEAERILKMKADRELLLSEYTETPEMYRSEQLDENAFNELLNGLKLAKQARIEAEQKAEAERLRLEAENKLHFERKESILNLWQFMDKDVQSLHFGQFTPDEWNKLTTALKKKKAEHDKDQERIKAENKRLEAERIEAERKVKEIADKAEIERKRIESERAKERQEAERKQKEIEAKATKATKEKAELEAKLKVENDAKEQAKKEAERKETERIEALKKASLAPDKEKIINYIESLSFQSLDVKTPAGMVVLSDIAAKFESFKKWAVSETNKL